MSIIDNTKITSLGLGYLWAYNAYSWPVSVLKDEMRSVRDGVANGYGDKDVVEKFNANLPSFNENAYTGVGGFIVPQGLKSKNIYSKVADNQFVKGNFGLVLEMTSSTWMKYYRTEVWGVTVDSSQSCVNGEVSGAWEYLIPKGYSGLYHPGITLTSKDDKNITIKSVPLQDESIYYNQLNWQGRRGWWGDISSMPSKTNPDYSWITYDGMSTVNQAKATAYKNMNNLWLMQGQGIPSSDGGSELEISTTSLYPRGQREYWYRQFPYNISGSSLKNELYALSRENSSDFFYGRVNECVGGNISDKITMYQSDLYRNSFRFVNNISMGNVVFRPVNESLNVTNATQVAVAQKTAPLSFAKKFTFIPGAGVNKSGFNTVIEQTIETSNTTGTTSDSTSSTDNSSTSSSGNSRGGSLTLTTTETAQAGEENVWSASFEASQELSTNWNNTWEKADTVNFSQSNSISNSSSTDKSKGISNSYTLSIDVDLGAATPTGKTKTGIPIYNYSRQITNPITQKSELKEFEFIVGDEYEWKVTFAEVIAKNTVSGNYTMSGDVGELSEYVGTNKGNSVNGKNIAQAFYYASQAPNAITITGEGTSSVSDLSDIINSFEGVDPATQSLISYPYKTVAEKGLSDEQIRYLQKVVINGKTDAQTTLAHTIETNLVRVHPKSSASSSASSAKLSRSSEKTEEQWVNLSNNTHDHPRNISASHSFVGTEADDKVRDWTGKDFIYTKSGDDKVVIRGNKHQAHHRGDYVELGSGNDHLNASKATGFNTIDAGRGDDKVVDGVMTDLSVNLGKGDDLFVHKGGVSHLTLGKGRDRVELSKIADESKVSKLVVSDFEIGVDKLTGVKDASLAFDWNDDLNALEHESDQYGELILHLGSKSLAAIDPDFWIGMGLQNIEQLSVNVKRVLRHDWQHVRNRFLKEGFRKNLSTDSWSDLSKNMADIKDLGSNISSAIGRDAFEVDLIKDLSEASNSHHAFAANLALI